MAEIDKVSKPASASWNALLTNRAEDQTEVEFALTSWLPGHIGKNTPYVVEKQNCQETYETLKDGGARFSSHRPKCLWRGGCIRGAVRASSHATE